MLHNIAIGIFLFISTTVLHTGGMLLTLGRFKALSRIRGSFPHHGRLYLMAMVVISMFIVIYAVQSLYAGEKRAP